MFNLCARAFERRSAELLAPLGVTPAYLPVLFTLSALGESTQAELAERATIEQPTMALTLRRMERDHLISRTKDKNDGRRAIVRLTGHAQELLPHIEAISMAINHTALRSLSDGEVDNLLGWAKKISENLADSQSIRDAVEVHMHPVASPKP